MHAIYLVAVILFLLGIIKLFFSPNGRSAAWMLMGASVAIFVLASIVGTGDRSLPGVAIAAGLGLFLLLFKRIRQFAKTVLVVAVVLAIGYAWTVSRPSENPGPPQGVDAVDDCRDIAFIGARGSGESRNGASGYGGYVERVRDLFEPEVTARGKTFADMPVDYPALPVEADAGWSYAKDLMSGDSLYKKGAEVGRDLLSARIRLINAVCGDTTKIVVVGYSQGAMSAHMALDELSAEDRRNVIAVEFIADPLRQPGTVDPSTGTAPTGQGVFLYYDYVDKVPGEVPGARSWCLEGDGVCAADNALVDTASDLVFGGVHTTGYGTAGVPEQIAALLVQGIE